MEKGAKKIYGVLLLTISKALGILEAIKDHAGAATKAAYEKLLILEKQLRGIYGPLLWNLQQNYILAADILNHYVLFSRAFYNAFLIVTQEKKEITAPAFLVQAKNLCELAQLGFNEEIEEKAGSFFQEVKVAWDAKVFESESKEIDVSELLVVLRKAVALQLGLVHKSVALGFYEVYERLAKENKFVSLEKYIEECKAAFPVPWEDEWKMKDLATTFYVYAGWKIEVISEDSLKNYAESHTRLAILQKLVYRYLDLVLEKYLDLYEYLVAQYFDEGVSAYSKKGGRKEEDVKELDSKMAKLEALNSKALSIFGFYKQEVTTFITTSKLYQWSTSVCEKILPLEFLKTNLLRLVELGMPIVQVFKEGMTIVYTQGVNTLHVVIETVKNPGAIIPELSKRFKQFKGYFVGCVLVLDFDADGWVSLDDFKNSMWSLYAFLKQYDYIGGAKDLYTKALAIVWGKKSNSSGERGKGKDEDKEKGKGSDKDKEKEKNPLPASDAKA